MNVQVFRLWPRRPRDGSLPLGLSCDDEGLLLAGNCRLVAACLDRDGRKFYRARPVEELNTVLSAGYGQPVDASPLYAAVEHIARHMTERNWTHATIAALHLRLPELADAEAASRVLKADALIKAVNPGTFDPAKHPRWPAGSLEGHGGEFSPRDGGDLLVPVQWQGALARAVLRILGRMAPEAERIPPPRIPFGPKPPETPETPPSEVKPGIGHNQPPEPIEGNPPGTPRPTIPELPAEPSFPASEITRFGRRVAEALAGAVAIGDFALAQGIAEAADKVGWLAKEYPNIISFLDPARTYEELNKAAQQKGRHDGFEDHHIVGQGPYNDYLDQSKVQGDDNIVRIPEYRHRMVNSYYDRPNPDMPELGGLTPRQYLQGKSFEEQFEFGKAVLRKFGVMK
jgi:hypothetical protein